MRQEQRMVVAEREVNSSAECATLFRRCRDGLSSGFCNSTMSCARTCRSS